MDKMKRVRYLNECCRTADKLNLCKSCLISGKDVKAVKGESFCKDCLDEKRKRKEWFDKIRYGK